MRSPRRSAVRRQIALEERRDRVQHLPPSRSRVRRRPGARARARARRPQYARSGEPRRTALVRLGRRAGQPLVAEPEAAARSPRDGRGRRARRLAGPQRAGAARVLRRAFGREPPADDEPSPSMPPRRSRRTRDAHDPSHVVRRLPRRARARRRTRWRRIRLLAQRGLAIFVGSGKCTTCHAGPRMSNGEFHDVGIPHFAEPGRVDPGRYGGIRKLQVESVQPARQVQRRSAATHARRARATSRSTTATTASSRCRRCAACRALRPTCTTAASRRCARWCATTRTSTSSGSTPTASASS